MAKVTAFEAKTRFGELLERVANGEEVVITRHDKPVARLIPEGAMLPLTPLDGQLLLCAVCGGVLFVNDFCATTAGVL